MPFAPAIPYQAPQLLEQGILSGAQTFNQDLMKALQKYEEDKKQREFNTGLLDTFKEDPSLSKYVPADALMKWDAMNGDKQAGLLAGVARRAQNDVQQQQLQMAEELKNAQTDEATARANLLWAQGQNEWTGQGPDQTLQLTPEEQSNYDKSGTVPVRTTAHSFQPVPMPDVTTIDTDTGGSPILSQDESMYRSGGKWKPVTEPMRKAREAFTDLQKANEEHAKKIQTQPGFSIFHPSTWGRSNAPASSPTIAPTTTRSTQDQQALDWARANPRDPRAVAILKKLGLIQ